MTAYTLVSDHVCTGLELEYEDVDPAEVQRIFAKNDIPYWDVGRDGSLRPADKNAELKFRGPLQGKQIVDAVQSLRLLDNIAMSVSWRCGMHVHVDYTGLMHTDTVKTYLLSTLLEPLLFQWAGPSRIESKFCARGASTVYHALHETGEGGNFTTKKYTAVNLSNIGGLNTVEFRYADCTRDRQMIMDFINVNLALRLAASSFDDHWALLESFAKYNNLPLWITDNLHTLASDVLLPLANTIQDEYPLEEVLPAALVLCKHQDKAAKRIVGTNPLYAQL